MSVRVLLPNAFQKHTNGTREFQSKAENLPQLITELETSLRAIFDELDEDENDSPGHDHMVAGHWDATGKPCEWCATWSAARKLLIHA